MNHETVTLTNNVEELKAIIYGFAEKQRSHESKQQNYETEIKFLKEEIDILKHRLFGRKSEKLSGEAGNGQLLLFNEAEHTEAEPETEKQEIEIPKHRRRKAGRRPLPANMPRVEVIHDIAEAEKICACGTEKSKIGQEVSEQLDYIPAKAQVIRNIRLKYACKNCEGVEADEPAVTIAKLPEQIIPKSIATPGLLAQLLTAKFADALPFYRQEKIFARIGIQLSRQTMCAWAIKVAQRCELLMELMRGEILSGPLINADETPVQVLKEPGRAPTTKSYMWIFRGGDIEKPALIYQYHATRSGDIPKQFLDTYKGYVQTDGYLGYDFLENIEDIEHMGCWAHVRRKFVDVLNAAKKGSKGTQKVGSADIALDYIRKLYVIEKDCRKQELNFDEIRTQRQQRAGPILDKFKKWIDKRSLQVPPQSLLGKAISYALGQWERLEVYLEDGRLRPDNNMAENAIRPFVVGRKNWMFSATPNGAHASAALYSLIETAKANGLEPYWYLRYLFERLPTAKTKKDHKAFLPQYVDKSQIGGPSS